MSAVRALAFVLIIGPTRELALRQAGSELSGLVLLEDPAGIGGRLGHISKLCGYQRREL